MTSNRFKILDAHDREFWDSGEAVAGIDEVGYGSLAGPVVAACVILDPEKTSILDGVYDSKKVTENERTRLASLIKDNALAIGLGEMTSQEVDRLGVYAALKVAMLKSVHFATFWLRPTLVLVDGSNIDLPLADPPFCLPYKCIVKGDQKSLSIAAASIIAKVYRDKVMIQKGLEYPNYGFSTNKGYGTAAHLRYLKEFGPCDLHRLSFAPLKNT